MKCRFSRLKTFTYLLIIVLHFTPKQQRNRLEFRTYTRIIHSNNRRHYICVKCDNVFWPILDFGLNYIYIYIRCKLLLRAFIVNVGSSKSFAIYRIGRSYDTCPRNFEIPNTYTMVNVGRGDQFLQ